MNVHPQQSLHALSLMGKDTYQSLQAPALHKLSKFKSGAPTVTASGSDTAQQFWLNASRLLHWSTPPSAAYGATPQTKPGWFPGGQLNTSYNCLDRHVFDGYGNRPCFHTFSSVPANRNPPKTYTYAQVLEQVKTVAGIFRDRGVKKGDRVIIYMPMIVETAIAMLACSRIGAIHSVVFGGFAPKELAKRIDDAKPSLIVAASCGIEPKGVIDYVPLVEEAMSYATHKDAPVLLYQRENVTGHDPPTTTFGKNCLSWTAEYNSVIKKRTQVESAEPMNSSDPIYILYTSGTTGTPKGVVRDSGGHAVALRYCAEYTMGFKREDVVFTASDFGWVVGHSFQVYSPLLVGASSVIFEGKPIVPDAGTFWRIIEAYKVTQLYTAPTALRSIRREDADASLLKKYNLKSLRTVFLAGERSEPGIVSYYQKILDEVAAPGAMVNDNYWSTESGSPITIIQTNTVFPSVTVKPGSAGLPAPGMDVRIVDDDGHEVAPGQMGNIVLGQPLAPSFMLTVWGNQQRYIEAYLDRFNKGESKGGWFDTGDAGVVDEQGYVSVLSRADDIINVAGHRLGTSLLEQVVSNHPYVAECCVVGLPDEIKGHVPFALIARRNTPEAQKAETSEILKAVNAHVRTDVGSFAALGGLVVGRLPKTRSGKTVRRTVKDLVENAHKGSYDAPCSYPPTIEDLTAIDDARKNINAFFKSRQPKL